MQFHPCTGFLPSIDDPYDFNLIMFTLLILLLTQQHIYIDSIAYPTTYINVGRVAYRIKANPKAKLATEQAGTVAGVVKAPLVLFQGIQH